MKSDRKLSPTFPRTYLKFQLDQEKNKLDTSSRFLRRCHAVLNIFVAIQSRKSIPGAHREKSDSVGATIHRGRNDSRTASDNTYMHRQGSGS
ncbi:hypothetical protein BDV26DRAFT_275070 [Aspergillus bertholletiae]|uniref:Uncharacterized protein n=1 Tax=Aspergillus bertholletiae TaxID=1226010 RepID=A0A5N7AQ22_9EURO|nr:hypothetical protein BDV26DRAFT_275070 [Aspergillus bertholletiae]